MKETEENRERKWVGWQMKGAQVSYRKSMDRYYLVITHEKNIRQDYQLQMVLENRISGLLPPEVKQRDGRKELYYDISSMQQLTRIYDRRELSATEMKKVFFGILDALMKMQEYMLEESRAVLDPAYIFLDMENAEVRLLFLPIWDGEEESGEDPMLQVAEYIMEHADHRDAEAALCAYRLYQTIRKGNYVMADLRRAFEKEGRERTESTGRIPAIPETDRKEELSEWDLPKPSPVGHEDLLKPKEEKKKEQNSRCVTYIPAVILILGGALVCSGSIPGIYPDSAGRLAAFAMMAAGVAVLLTGLLRSGKAGGKRSGKKKLQTSDFDDVFADLSTQKEVDDVPESRDREPIRRGTDSRTEDTDLFEPSFFGEGVRDAGEKEMFFGRDEQETFGRTVFVGEVDAPVENILVEKRRKKEYPMSHFPFTIGKMKDCVDLVLNDCTVSRIHARILMQNGKAYLQDCHSTNGTYLNGVQLEAEEKVMLEKDDEIEFGKVKFCYI